MKTKNIFSLIFFVVIFCFVFGLSCGLFNGVASAIVHVEDPPPEAAAPGPAPEPAKTPQPPESAIQVSMPNISADTGIAGKAAAEPVEMPNAANLEGNAVGPNVTAEDNLVAPVDATGQNAGQPVAGEVTQAPNTE